MENQLEGKIAVVTGAASGIGLATTERLLQAGATVVLVDRNKQALNSIIDRLGKSAVAQITDLLDADSCASMVQEILGKTEKIDILYCNAGSYIGGDLAETNESAIDQMLNLNVNAVVKNVYTVLPHMKERRTGDIIVTSSLAGHSAIVHEPVYSASKWAITCFVETMRRQLNKHGIRVGQVSPGPVNSALLAGWSQEMLRATIEAGAVIEPSEVAEAVMFMLTRPRNVTIRDVIILPTNVDA